jgi:phosphoribosylformylglycinamidine cyclo-ligase
MSSESDSPKKRGLTYCDAGVDIDAMDRALSEIGKLAGSTATPGVLSSVGSFGGLFHLEGAGSPVLVASVDGVGTKLRVAHEAGIHDTVGADLVNHCINDILVQGAVPLFFMDYFAAGRLEPEVIVQVVRGVARACREASCALLGGETAEMPGFYATGDYDVAGFIVGLVERGEVMTGAGIRPGDLLLGLPSTGLHTNGYSLARKVFFEVRGLDVHSRIPELEATAAEALLAPHRSYLGVLRDLLPGGKIRGMAHITGGGMTDNLPRILPAGCAAEVRRGAWPVLPIFDLIQRWGEVSGEEMERTFNQGIGMILVVAPESVTEVQEHLRRQGETVHSIGRIVEGDRRVLYRDEGKA